MAPFFDNSPKEMPCVLPNEFTLTDCIACSGCITADEADRFAVSTEFLNDKSTPTAIIISPQVKKSIYSHYKNISFEDFEKFLVFFLKNTFNIIKIVDTSYFGKQNNTGISSECPAVVLYVERAYPSLLPQLSQSKTYQQIASEYISKELGINCDFKYRVVSIMQCYDKKDELHRDNTQINFYIGTKEFYKFIEKNFEPEILKDYNLEDWERCHDYKIDEITGLENCLNVLRRSKTEKVCYVELKICPGGCIKGPAQLEPKNELEDFTVNFDRKIVIETEARKFKQPRKRTFKVEW